PRCRRQIAAGQVNLVFAVGIEAAESVEALESGARVGRLRMNGHRAERNDVAVHYLQLGRISVFDSRELEEIAEPQSVAIHLHPRHRLEESDVLRLEQVSPTYEHAARSVEQSSFTRRHRRRQQLVAQLLHVAEWMHVEN